MHLNVRKILNTCTVVTWCLVFTACGVADNLDVATVPEQSTPLSGSSKIRPPSTQARTVLHYEPDPEGINGGSWYLHWPGTFGVARIRLPASLHLECFSNLRSPAQPGECLVAQLIRRSSSTGP